VGSKIKIETHAETKQESSSLFTQKQLKNKPKMGKRCGARSEI